MYLEGIFGQVIATLLVALILGVVSWLRRRQRGPSRRAEANRELIYALVRFLENRRALYTRWADEIPQMVVDSVHEIRSRLMEDIERLGETSKDAPTLLRMQRACREFLTVADSIPHLEHSQPPQDERLNGFLQALLTLRQVFHTEMDNLRSKYRMESGPPPEDVNPFIAREEETIEVASWPDQSDEAERRPPQTDPPGQDK